MQITLLKIVLALSVLASLSNAQCMNKKLNVENTMRTAILCEPQDLISAMPLVLVYHGRGGSAKDMLGTALHKEWPEALVLYMDGLKGNSAPYDPKGKRAGWQINTGDMGDRDLRFTDAVLKVLFNNYKIDIKKIFVVGHSNGSRFGALLWATSGEMFKGFAFSAGQAGTLIGQVRLNNVFMGMGKEDNLIKFDRQKMSIKYAINRFDMTLEKDIKKGVKLYKDKTGKKLLSYIHDRGHIWPKEQTKDIISFFKSLE